MAFPERRRTQRLRIYWERIRRDRAFPAMRDIDPERLPVEWADCFVIADVVRTPRFEYVGKSLTLDCGRDLTNRPVAAAPPATLIGQSTSGVAEVLSSRTPVVVEGEFQHASGPVLQYRSIILPFSDNRQTIDCLVGAATWRRAEND